MLKKFNCDSRVHAESSPTHPSSGRERSHASKLRQKALPRIQTKADSSSMHLSSGRELSDVSGV